MSEFPEIQPFGPRPAPHNEDPSNETRAVSARRARGQACNRRSAESPEPNDSRCNGRRCRVCSWLPCVPISATDPSPKQA